MHCFAILLALGLTWTGLPAGWAQEDPADEVTVPDAALRAVLEDSLGLSAGGPITEASLAELTTLEAPDAGIVDLTGLEYATGLTRLDLGPGAITRDPWTNTNAVSGLSPLSGLTALTWLDLAGNSVEDVTPLSDLVNLRWLNVEVNRISDLRSMSGLTKLRDLHMGYNLIPTLELADWLPGWQQRVDIHLDFWHSDRELWPKLDGPLNRRVRSYKEALRWGRTTDEVVVDPSRCFTRFPPSDDWDPSMPDFYAWDPSKPPHSVPVRIFLLDREESSIDRVVGFLSDHCIILGDYNIYRVPSGEQGWNLIYACVPVPLLVPLSEVPSVGRVRRPPSGDFPQTSTGGESGDSGAGGQDGCGSDLPGTGVEASSWGAIKSLFR